VGDPPSFLHVFVRFVGDQKNVEKLSLQARLHWVYRIPKIFITAPKFYIFLAWTGPAGRFEQMRTLTCPTRNDIMPRVMKAPRAFLTASLGAAMLLSGAALAGEKVQIQGSTAAEIPKPTRSLEERGFKLDRGEGGKSEVEGGFAAPPQESNSRLRNRKLRELVDKERNWVFANPYEQAGEGDSENSFGGADGSGLSDHRWMRGEEKSAVEKFLAERDNADKEKGEKAGHGEARRAEQETFRGSLFSNEETGPAQQEKLSLFGTGTDNRNQNTSGLAGNKSAFEQRLERSPFSESRFSERKPELTEAGKRDMLQQREQRAADFEKFIQPRGLSGANGLNPGAALGGRLDPVNTSVDFTRRELNPIAGGRSDSLLGGGAGGRASSLPGGGSGLGTDSRLSIAGSLPGARGAEDIGRNIARPSAFAPNAGPAVSAPSGTFSGLPYVLPPQQRKF